jgi:hypothetical protein
VDRATVCGGQTWLGMRRFRMRMLEKVNIEALMTATGQNIKRLLSIRGRGPEKLAQAAALRPPTSPQLAYAHRRSDNRRQKRRVRTTFFNKLSS